MFKFGIQINLGIHLPKRRENECSYIISVSYAFHAWGDLDSFQAIYTDLTAYFYYLWNETLFSLLGEKIRKRKNNSNCIFDITVDSGPDKNFVVLWRTHVKIVTLLTCLLKQNYFSEINLNLYFYYVGKNEMKQFKIIYL